MLYAVIYLYYLGRVSRLDLGLRDMGVERHVCGGFAEEVTLKLLQVARRKFHLMILATGHVAIQI